MGGAAGQKVAAIQLSTLCRNTHRSVVLSWWYFYLVLNLKVISNSSQGMVDEVSFGK